MIWVALWLGSGLIWGWFRVGVGEGGFRVCLVLGRGISGDRGRLGHSGRWAWEAGCEPSNKPRCGSYWSPKAQDAGHRNKMVVFSLEPFLCIDPQTDKAQMVLDALDEQLFADHLWLDHFGLFLPEASSYHF